MRSKGGNGETLSFVTVLSDICSSGTSLSPETLQPSAKRSEPLTIFRLLYICCLEMYGPLFSQSNHHASEVGHVMHLAVVCSLGVSVGSVAYTET